MECGLPVIAYDLPLYEKEIIKDNGIIVPLGNEEEFVKAMLELAENIDKRKELAQNSIERAKYFI